MRGGIFDRIQVSQGLDSFTFRDLDYLNLWGIARRRAEVSRIGHLHPQPELQRAYPWSLVFLGNRVDGQTGARSFATFEQEYWVPARYLEGGRPAVQRPEPSWLRVWKARKFEIAAFVLFLAAVTTVYALRDRLVRRANRKDHRWVDVPKYLIWAVSIVMVGFYFTATPSITHVLTWFHSLVFQWRWDLFLSDPLIFIFWWFIIITVFIWGRGVLRVALSLWRAQRGGAQGGGRTRAEAVPPAAQGARQGEVAEVRRLRDAGGGFVRFDLDRGSDGRGGAVQVHVPRRRRVEPLVAVRAVLDCAVRHLAVRRAAVLQVPVPARRGAGDPDHVPGRALEAQGRVRNLSRMPERLRLAGDRRCRPHRPARMPAVPGLPDPLLRPACLSAAVQGAPRQDEAGLPLTPIGPDGYYIPIKLVQ